ncbi:MAG: hypothetical protein IKJ28_03730 [Alphaproteobacteria bacterium]|nr:hypothetical protein [Alphaproteobacteria bacterium]
MKIVSILFLFLSIGVLQGCSYPCYSTQGCRDLLLSTVNTEDFGKKPNKKDVENTAHELIKDVLKDPDSVKFKKMTDPVRCYRAGDYGYIFEYGWCFVVSYNAKNSYGGYVGYKDAIFLYNKDGSVKWTKSASLNFSPGFGMVVLDDLQFKNFDTDKKEWLKFQNEIKD